VKKKWPPGEYHNESKLHVDVAENSREYDDHSVVKKICWAVLALLACGNSQIETSSILVDITYPIMQKAKDQRQALKLWPNDEFLRGRYVLFVVTLFSYMKNIHCSPLVTLPRMTGKLW
jgi:hypothetical protein